MGSASVARSLVHVVTASSLWTLALYLYLVLKSLDIVDVFAGLYFWFNAMRLTRSRFESRKTYKNPTLLQPYIRYLMLCGRDVGLYDAFLVEKLCIAVCLFENFHYGPNGMLIWKKICNQSNKNVWSRIPEYLTVACLFQNHVFLL